MAVGVACRRDLKNFIQQFLLGPAVGDCNRACETNGQAMTIGREQVIHLPTHSPG